MSNKQLIQKSKIADSSQMNKGKKRNNTRLTEGHFAVIFSFRLLNYTKRSFSYICNKVSKKVLFYHPKTRLSGLEKTLFSQQKVHFLL
ncbi:hypothetical protein TW85_03975 [Marinomonas sp. S3726]|nr:hypothetical protein TW85_03975 [Marinomonas sp. S3726]